MSPIMIAPLDREAQLEETIADLEALYDWHAMILSQARVGVLDWPVESCRVYMSPCLKSLLGYQEHELPNAFQEWLNHIHQDDRGLVTAELKAAVDNGTPRYQRVHRVIRKDGSAGWILFRAQITAGSDGRQKRLLGAVIDISDIRSLITAADETAAN